MCLRNIDRSFKPAKIGYQVRFKLRDGTYNSPYYKFNHGMGVVKAPDGWTLEDGFHVSHNIRAARKLRETLKTDLDYDWTILKCRILKPIVQGIDGITGDRCTVASEVEYLEEVE